MGLSFRVPILEVLILATVLVVAVTVGQGRRRTGALELVRAGPRGLQCLQDDRPDVGNR